MKVKQLWSFNTRNSELSISLQTQTPRKRDAFVFTMSYLISLYPQACLPWIRHILIHQFVSTSMLTLIILFWSLSSVHWSNLFFLCYVRASFVFKAVSAYQAWEGQCPMRKLWHGRFWMKKKTPTVFASCLWTGLLFETLSQKVGTWQLD